jgi:valyl-tRNA synthetase
MLPSHFDPATAEARIYARWEASGCFAPQGEGEPYTVMIPPPNVTGSLHIGHALNNTLQDVLVRFERMRGRRVLWQPGTDHAGIATQMVVERQLATAGNEDRRSMGRARFLERVWEWKAESGGQILNQLKRLGASCDWSRERFTMDEGLSEAVRKVFVDLYHQGLIYRDKRLVNWDTQFETAVSDLEVVNEERKGHFWHFKYPLADGETYEFPTAFDDEGRPTAWETRDYIAIATTRPETMLGDGAVAVHPDDKRYASIVGKKVRLPLADRLIPIIADEYPDPDFGSGAVKITGAHDFNDYQVARRHDIALFVLMDAKGRMAAEPYVPAQYRGLDRFEARKRIVADIDALGLLERVEDKKIMQPIGDRSGTVIEPMLTDQWYVDAKTLAGPALDAVRTGKTRFIPESWTKTYYNWLENIEPWCVSRQLWWGHQIPAWYAADGSVFVAHTEAEAVEQARVKSGNDVALTQDEDVLDTWFSSALWPFSTLGWPEDTDAFRTHYPTSTLVTGFDIIFFWVARMMMQGIHFTGEPPFKDVYVHALVRDAKGAKMSKSKGNVVNPLDLIDKYGADALRFTLAAMAAQGRDIKLSEDRIDGYRRFGTKLWNAAKFMQMNACQPWPGGTLDAAGLHLTTSHWILGELGATAAQVTADLEAYRFNDAASALYRFVWNVLCDWYIELSKPIFAGDDDTAKAEVRSVAGYVLDETLKLLHPFMPFLTEELWEQLVADGPERAGLLAVEHWPPGPVAGIRAEAAAEIDWVIGLVTEVRSMRADLNVPASVKVPLTLVGATAEQGVWLARYRAEVERLARLASSAEAAAVPAGAVAFVHHGAEVGLEVAEHINLEAELARLDKEVLRLTDDITKAQAKLDSADFLARAPEEVVDEHRDRVESATLARAKYQEALARLRRG